LVEDQAKTAGLPGTIALAKNMAEIASEKTAAAARFGLKMLIVFSFLCVPVRPSRRVAQYTASGVPVLKNGRILRFLRVLRSERLFINPKGWEFSPTFDIVDFVAIAGPRG